MHPTAQGGETSGDDKYYKADQGRINARRLRRFRMIAAGNDLAAKFRVQDIAQEQECERGIARARA